MSEYLRVKNFGPIVDIEFDNIAPLTILIGESGSGKSTIMKVLSMFRWIYKRVVLRSYVRQAKIKKTGIGIQIWVGASATHILKPTAHSSARITSSTRTRRRLRRRRENSLR